MTRHDVHPAPWPFGAAPTAGATRFTLPAPGARAVDVRVGPPGTPASWRPLDCQPDGTWSALVAGAGAGDRYQFRVDGGPPWPDPASRFQPEGVHGPSEVVDPTRYAWQDRDWAGIALEDAVIYELHVGAFTAEGTFLAAAGRLPALKALGVTAVELMPVADFPGRWNWGYDGVALFAPARAYGRPDDFRRFVDRAHALGLAVYLDVVYNHLGPDGAYTAALLPAIFSKRHSSPWGRGLNYDEEGSDLLRRLVIENATCWVTEYHLDGLRFDATHAIVDEGSEHILAAATSAVRQVVRGRRVQLIAEDHRNLAAMVRPVPEGGLGFDAVWADDFHHQVRRCIAGDADGYFADFTGGLADLAATVRQGWFYRGQHSSYLGGPRGTDPEALPFASFVIAIQNHDQVGNRALGDRLHHRIDEASYRAASVLLLVAPETPLLFMGQEWAATSPFLYFTDHEPELGGLVTRGRRREFERFEAFARPEAAAAIPDPQAPSTFERSRLAWDEVSREGHGRVADLYRAALGLRRRWRPGRARRGEVRVEPAGDGGIAVVYRHVPGVVLAAIVWLRGAGEAALDAVWLGAPSTDSAIVEPAVTLSTESAPFVEHPAPPRIDVEGRVLRIRFDRPGALALEWQVGGGTP